MQQAAHQAGRVQEDELEDLNRAFPWYLRSVRDYDRMRGQLESREYKTSFQERRGLVFRRGVGVSLDLSQRQRHAGRQQRLWREAFEMAERGKCRILYDLVEAAGSDANAPQARSATESLSLSAVVDEALGDDAALLEFERLRDGRIAVFVVAGRRGLVGEPLVLDGDAVRRPLIKLLNCLYDSGEARRRGAHYVNRLLFLLARAVLPDVIRERLSQLGPRRLVIVADEETNLVPFHALPMRVNGTTECLCDRYAVSYAPQMSLYRLACQRALSRGRSSRVVVVGPDNERETDLISGDEEFYETACSFNDLILPRVSELFGDSGASFTQAPPEQFFATAGDAELWHFYGHGGVPSKEVADFRLFFWEGTLTHRQILAADPSFRLDRTAIMTLAACSVGQVDFYSQRAAREIDGMTAALLERGAPAIISALWPAGKLAAMTFFELFYERFAPDTGQGVSRGEAYHEALRELRAMPEFSAPWQWAPFYLSGADN